MLDEDYSNKEYQFSPGDVVAHKLTKTKCVVLRQLPIKGDDVGMKEKYYVREQGGRKFSYYGVELESTET